MFEVKERKLQFEFKRNRSNTWELKVRNEVRNCCETAQSIDQFVNGFTYSLKSYRMDSYKSISDTYRVKKIDHNTAHVVWVNYHEGPGTDKLVAVIKTIKNI